MKIIRGGKQETISEKDFRNLLGGNLGGSDLGDWMEYADKHKDEGKSVSQLFDEYNKRKIDNNK